MTADGIVAQASILRTLIKEFLHDPQELRDPLVVADGGHDDVARGAADYDAT